MRHRLRTALATVAVTGALAGGGAAIASAATSSTATTPTTPTTPTTTHTTPSQAPSGSSTSHAPAGGAKNCPNM